MKKLNIPFNALLDIRKAGTTDKGDWIVEGFCATSDLDLQGDVITEEALDASAKDLLENSTVLFNHDENRPIGKVVDAKKMTLDGTLGLWVKVMISKAEPKLWTNIKEGVLNKFSIRGKVLRAKKEFYALLNHVANVIYRMKLIETSLVSLPANPKARALRWYVSKALKDFQDEGGNIEMTLEEIIAEMLKGMPELPEFLKQFQDFCVEKKVDFEKSTPEELDAVFAEYLKQEGKPGEHAMAVQSAMEAVEALIEKLPDELKESGKALLTLIQKIKDTLSAYPKPYPAPAKKEGDDEEDEEDKEKAKEKKDEEDDEDEEKKKEKKDDEEDEDGKKKSGVWAALANFISGKAQEAEKSGEDLDAEKLKEDIGRFLEQKSEEDAQATQKSISDLGADITKQVGDMVGDLTKKFEDAIGGVSETVTKTGKDILSLVDRVEKIEKAVPVKTDADPDPDEKKASFSGVFVPRSRNVREKDDEE